MRLQKAGSLALLPLVLLGLANCGSTYEEPEAAESLILEEGTSLAVMTTDALSAVDETAGDSFSGTLAEPLQVNGEIIAPQGSPVEGLIVNRAQTQPGETGGMVELKLTQITLMSGEEVEIDTESVQYPSIAGGQQTEMPGIVPETKTIVFRLAQDVTVERDASDPNAAAY